MAILNRLAHFARPGLCLPALPFLARCNQTSDLPTQQVAIFQVRRREIDSCHPPRSPGLSSLTPKIVHLPSRGDLSDAGMDHLQDCAAAGSSYLCTRTADAVMFVMAQSCHARQTATGSMVAFLDASIIRLWDRRFLQTVATSPPKSAGRRSVAL